MTLNEISMRKPGYNGKKENRCFYPRKTMLSMGSSLKEYGLLDLVDWYN